MQNDNITRKVVASAIDNDCLILEEQDTGEKIEWPLDKIPQPIELGHTLDLTLQAETTVTHKTPSNKDEDDMRKELEKLVN